MNTNDEKTQPEIEEEDVIRLRARWELASVINFLKVFGPILGDELKFTAEEIEKSLISPDRCLRLIHIALLKGIPPVSKNLKDPDVWVVTLSKKLFMWWPWVAEGDFPLTAAKGAEMETYKNLDPAVRLVVLKALCEIRADQHDAIAYINDAVRKKNEISTIRKTNIGEDGKGASYWLDGNETLGFRLYKELNTLKENVTPPAISFHWETLATNLDEFQKVVAEYSSSKSKLEVAVCAAVETEAIPVLNRIFKKKRRELERKRNEERIMTSFSRSGITRSCRNRKPINYTFDDYDKVISNAIRESKRLKTRDELRSEKKETLGKENLPKAGKGDSTESGEKDINEDSGEESDENVVSKESGEEADENNVSKDSGEESDDNDVAEDSGAESDVNEVVEDSGEESDVNEVVQDSDEESDENAVYEDSGEESDENAASEDSGEESDENDEDNKDNMNLSSSKNGKKKSRYQQRIKKKESKESEEDSESTESDSDSESSEHETKDIVENNDDNKENKNHSSKANAEKADRLMHKMETFGTKKRLVQRPNRNTAIESAVVSDSEDDISSENSDN